MDTTLVGGAGADTFAGFVSGTAGASTLTGGDQLKGNGGTDTLSILIDTSTLANTMTPQLDSVEAITIRNLSAVANVDDLNLVQATGVTSVTLTNSLGTGDTAVTNAPLAATYSITATPAVAAGGAIADLAVTIDAGALGGTADTVKFSVSGAGSKAATNVADRAILSVANTAGVEGVSLATTGVNFVTVDGGGADTRTLTITGDGTNSIAIADFNATLAINASGSTGANTFVLGADLTSSDSVTGGSGADVLSIAPTGSATAVVVGGVETLRIEQGSTTGVNIGFASNPGFATIDMRDSDGDTHIVTGINAGTTLAFTGADTTAGNTTFGLGRATNDTTFGTVQFNTAFSGTDDTLAIRLGNQGVTSSGAYAGSVRASGIENITIAQSDINSSSTTTTTLTNTGLKTVTATSAGNLSLTVDTRADQAPNYSGSASTASSNSITKLDFSGVVGTTTLSMAGGTANTSSWAAASQLLTSQGGMTFTFGVETATDVITVTGNAGVDSITTGTTGSFVANLAGGNDVFTAAAITTAGNGTVNVNGGDGDDNLTGGINADTLVGGAGADTIQGGRGADVIDGGVGADIIQVTAGAAAAAGTNQVTTLAPLGLGATEFLNVTIGGNTYSTVFNTNVATTLTDFVTAHATAIKGSTGGATNGVVVTAGATQLIFTATGTNTTSNGVMTSTGYTFTAPTATITAAQNSGATGGRVITNVFNSYVVTPNGDFDTAGDTFAVAGATVTYQTSVANSLALFAAGNPTAGAYAVVDNGNGTLTLYSSSTATGTATATAPTTAAGTGASAAGIGAATDLSAADSVAGVSAALPAASHSSYLVTGTGVDAVITSTIDVLTYEQGDTIDFTTATIVRASANNGVAGTSATIDNATGIATFAAAPGSLNAALTEIAAGIHATGGTNAGEAVVFQFGGKTYVYISDAAQGHSAADVVIEIVGAPATLTSGLTITAGGDIGGIG